MAVLTRTLSGARGPHWLHAVSSPCRAHCLPATWPLSDPNRHGRYSLYLALPNSYSSFGTESVSRQSKLGPSTPPPVTVTAPSPLFTILVTICNYIPSSVWFPHRKWAPAAVSMLSSGVCQYTGCVADAWNDRWMNKWMLTSLPEISALVS